MTVQDIIRWPFYWVYDVCVTILMCAVAVIGLLIQTIIFAISNRANLKKAAINLSRDFVALYQFMAGSPFGCGARFFSLIVGVVAPYSASIVSCAA